MLADVMVEVGKEQNSLSSADGNKDIAPVRLGFHALARHVPERRVVYLDKIRATQPLPERSVLFRYLVFSLVMLDGDHGRHCLDKSLSVGRGDRPPRPLVRLGSVAPLSMVRPIPPWQGLLLGVTNLDTCRLTQYCRQLAEAAQ